MKRKMDSFSPSTLNVTGVDDRELSAGMGTDEHAASESSHFDNEVVSTLGADETSEKDPVSPKMLSWDEKKTLCHSFKGVRRREVTLWFPNSASLGNVKSTETFKRIERFAMTPSSQLEYGVVVEEVVGCDRDTTTEVRMALKIKIKNAGIVGDFLWKLYKYVFPRYDFEIRLDLSDKSVYLAKARELVAPLEARKMDMEPFVFGETFYELLIRMENAAKGAMRSTKISYSWTRYPLKLLSAVMNSGGDWITFIDTDVFKKIGEKYPFHCRYAFDVLSKNVSMIESELESLGEESSVEDDTQRRMRNRRKEQMQSLWDIVYGTSGNGKVRDGEMQRLIGGSA